jgi:hypothetical protein
MVLVRTILAAFIAVSVAMSLAIGEAVMSPSPDQVAMADQADMPCCRCCNSNTQNQSNPTACVLKCMTLAGAVLPATNVAQPYLVDGRPLPFVDDTSHGVVTKPPTHPPPA